MNGRRVDRGTTKKCRTDKRPSVENPASPAPSNRPSRLRLSLIVDKELFNIDIYEMNILDLPDEIFGVIGAHIRRDKDKFAGLGPCPLPSPSFSLHLLLPYHLPCEIF